MIRDIARELVLSADATKGNLCLPYERFGIAGLPPNQRRAELARRAIQIGRAGIRPRGAE